MEELCIDLQHKLLTAVTDDRQLLELIREAKAEVTVEEKDIDEVDIVVNLVTDYSRTSAESRREIWVTDTERG